MSVNECSFVSYLRLPCSQKVPVKIGARVRGFCPDIICQTLYYRQSHERGMSALLLYHPGFTGGYLKIACVGIFLSNIQSKICMYNLLHIGLENITITPYKLRQIFGQFGLYLRNQVVNDSRVQVSTDNIEFTEMHVHSIYFKAQDLFERPPYPCRFRTSCKIVQIKRVHNIVNRHWRKPLTNLISTTILVVL